MTSSKEVFLGDIWLTHLHFIDKPDVGKVRLVLILSVEDDLQVIALKVTTKDPNDRRRSLFLDD